MVQILTDFSEPIPNPPKLMTLPTKSFSIKNWSQDDQPREKLIDKGARILSDAELVAILIGSSFNVCHFDMQFLGS